ncbi:MAG: hypothetical protein M3N68_05255 [Actinomycetota bacterium]|nr:hypothetical protein [Actinomycetota bacterium]
MSGSEHAAQLPDADLIESVAHALYDAAPSNFDKVVHTLLWDYENSALGEFTAIDSSGSETSLPSPPGVNALLAGIRTRQASAQHPAWEKSVVTVRRDGTFDADFEYPD